MIAMDDMQLHQVIRGLRAVTRQGAFKWEKTDDPNAFMLSRPQGVAVISRRPNRGGYLRSSLIIKDEEGETVVEWHETDRRQELDEPVGELFASAEASASDVQRHLSAWLTDIADQGEPS